jgi:serine/threonine-protein kinase
VALKLISGNATQEYVQRFCEEIRNLSALSHPNIVSIYESGETSERQLYFSMEYLPNTLSKSIQEKKISLKDALLLTQVLASALEYVHEHNIIHRDIKPSNVLLDTKGTPKLTDFGLAKMVTLSETERGNLTLTGQPLGTPQYMPPEQAEGKKEAVDTRSDIYSLGAMLYEMLTSQPPFTGNSNVEILLKVVQEFPIPPSELNPEVNKELDALCLKALKKDPAERYQSAKEFREAINTLELSTKPSASTRGSSVTTNKTSLPKPSLTRETTPKVKRKTSKIKKQPALKRPRLTIAVVAILVVVLGIGLFATKFSQPSQVVRKEKETAREERLAKEAKEKEETVKKEEERLAKEAQAKWEEVENAHNSADKLKLLEQFIQKYPKSVFYPKALELQTSLKEAQERTLRERVGEPPPPTEAGASRSSLRLSLERHSVRNASSTKDV